MQLLDSSNGNFILSLYQASAMSRNVYSCPKNSSKLVKAKKARAGKYDEKLAVEGMTFDELISMSANYTPPKKETVKKPAKKAVKKKK